MFILCQLNSKNPTQVGYTGMLGLYNSGLYHSVKRPMPVIKILATFYFGAPLRGTPRQYAELIINQVPRNKLAITPQNGGA
jgi:hypothetical protein